MSESYGERVARAREEMGLTQGEFAEKAGIPKRTLQDIENGKVTNPQRRNRDKIDTVLGLHVEGETAKTWSSGVRALVDLFGAFLEALPESDRTAVMHEAIGRLARWERAE